MKCTAYKTESGKIYGTYTADSLDSITEQLFEGQSIIEGDYDGRTKYIANEKVEERPEFTPIVERTSFLANGIDVFVISGIPETETECWLFGIVEDHWFQSDDTIEITSNTSGAFRLVIEAWPYTRQEIVFYAT